MNRSTRPVVALLSFCLVAGAACSSSGNGNTPKPGGKDVERSFKLASTNTLNAESMRFSINFGFNGESEAITISMDFFDFGAQADVSSPPAAEVVDFIEALEGLG